MDDEINKGSSLKEQARNTEALGEINRAIKELKNHNFFKMYDSYSKLFLLHFVKGTAFGLGSIIGAGIVIYFLAQLFSQIELIPIIGDWATEILNEIKLSDSGKS